MITPFGMIIQFVYDCLIACCKISQLIQLLYYQKDWKSPTETMLKKENWPDFSSKILVINYYLILDLNVIICDSLLVCLNINKLISPLYTILKHYCQAQPKPNWSYSWGLRWSLFFTDPATSSPSPLFKKEPYQRNVCILYL